jgi:hypothetical protein
VSVEGVPPSTTSNAVSLLGKGRTDPAASVPDFGQTPLPIPDSAALVSKSLEVLRGLTESEIFKLLGQLQEQVPGLIPSATSGPPEVGSCRWAALPKPQTLGLKLHFYLDDWLLHDTSKDILKSQMTLLIKNVKLAGWIMNEEKLELTPSQDFIFIRIRFCTRVGLMFPPLQTGSSRYCPGSGNCQL